MTDPLSQWLAAQRESVERWLAASQSQTGAASDATQDEARRWWQSLTQHLSPSAQELAAQLAQLGPGFLAGAGDALNELFGVRANAAESNVNATRWMDIAPIGYFREQQAHAQELAKALAEYHRVAAEMSGAITHIHAQALELLAGKVQGLQAQGAPVSDTRQLYDLWIGSAEQAFAQYARGETYGRLQGQLVNAVARVRMAQQTIAEEFLRSLDLPTRAELNSVHRRLKELRERVERLEAAKGR